ACKSFRRKLWVVDRCDYDRCPVLVITIDAESNEKINGSARKNGYDPTSINGTSKASSKSANARRTNAFKPTNDGSVSGQRNFNDRRNRMFAAFDSNADLCCIICRN